MARCRAAARAPEVSGGNRGPSARALEFAIRAFLVRQRTGGSGVYLLSATPAKTARLNISRCSASLMERHGHGWESQTRRLHRSIPKNRSDGVMDTDLKRRFREVVVGFMNLDELREIIFRFAEFRTAEEVGLKLPKVEPETIKVPMEAHKRTSTSGGLTSTACS